MVCMATSLSELPGSRTSLSQCDSTDVDKTDIADGNERNNSARVDIIKEFSGTIKDIGESELSAMRPRSFSDVSFREFKQRQLNTKEEQRVDKYRSRNVDFESKNVDDLSSKRTLAATAGIKSGKDLEKKQSVKVIICRESENVNELERGRKIHQSKDRECASKTTPLLTRSKSAHGRTNFSSLSEDEDDIPPPKPALPEKYRTSYFLQQFQNLKNSKSQSELETGLEEHEKYLFKSDLPNVERGLSVSGNEYRSSLGTCQTDEKIGKLNLMGSSKSGKTQSSKIEKLDPKSEGKDTRNGSKNKSNIFSGRRSKPFRSDSKIAVFRSYDAKLRAIALKRELDTLRSSEHVRHRLSSAEQTDVTDFKRDISHLRKTGSDKSEDSSVQNSSTVTYEIGGDMYISYSARSKTAGARNFAQKTHGSKPDGATTLSGKSKTENIRQNQGATSIMLQNDVSVFHSKDGSQIPSGVSRKAFPQSGALKGSNLNQDSETLNHTSEIMPKMVEAEAGQHRYCLTRRNLRSKSEPSLLRKTINSDTIPKTKAHDLDQNQVQDRSSVLTKSVPHLDNRGKDHTEFGRAAPHIKRKQDTIRKFNYDSFAQLREKIRTDYQRKPDRKDSDSPQYIATADVDTFGNVAKLNRKASDAASMGDNRSDEEKFAALSRSKIVHTKSSSLDSHLESNSRIQQHKKVVHPVIKLASSTSLTDYRSSPVDTTLVLDSSSSSDSLDVYLSENKGVKHETFNTDIPPLPKKTLKQNTVGIQSQDGKIPQGGEKSTQQKVVLRQCRIGSDVAFSLIGLKKTDPKPNGNGFLDGQGLVTLRMIPDEQGRFGFNVKGGADQGRPIIVSRVAPNTPADNCIPRLNEGDEVLFINGRDVSQHTHEQVVMFIRASRETHSGELILKIRPNVNFGEDNMDEPDLVYDPDTHQISSASGANALEVSLKVLEESLDSGAALAQFEQLYRKKPGMTMNAARLENNIPKNRYRDISPYDQTRVLIKNGTNGDYINANYVNMEIPVSGIVNRYIAAQGPLPATCTDFWQMVWEQQSTLVVMLTTKVERGRIKCHQYWPDNYETSDFGTLQITCVKEEETASFAFREFNLTNVETNEERHISHMQYIAWPDHGVPDDPADFLEFVVKVRQKRVGIVEPVIVHCSAGIGRTGVLITMETAMCLIEANQPVYPLSIVRQMRDQRAMLIQTPSQYKFVCEAIIRSYNESIVKPSPDYQR